jgi:hypothetical protein
MYISLFFIRLSPGMFTSFHVCLFTYLYSCLTASVV